MVTAVLFISSLLSQLAISSKDYTNCKWFGGNETNAPIWPIGVCTAHSHETELDDLSLYSTKYECNDNGELTQFEWNNTECTGAAYNNVIYRKEDGYFFHCDAPTSCPFTKVVLRELRHSPNGNRSTRYGRRHPSKHDEHLCSFDNNAYHEVAVVTNICIDFIEEYNTSFYVDCDAHTVSYTEYNDTECTTKTEANDHFVVKEGCEDEFGIGAYIQVAECDDANYHHHSSSDDTSKSSSSDSHLAVILCLVVALVIFGLVVAIVAIVVRRKSQREVSQMNVDAQPFKVDFKSIEDGDGGGIVPGEPDNTQHITTQGQDVKEIPILSAHS